MEKGEESERKKINFKYKNNFISAIVEQWDDDREENVFTLINGESAAEQLKHDEFQNTENCD